MAVLPPVTRPQPLGELRRAVGPEQVDQRVGERDAPTGPLRFRLGEHDSVTGDPVQGRLTVSAPASRSLSDQRSASASDWRSPRPSAVAHRAQLPATLRGAKHPAGLFRGERTARRRATGPIVEIAL